MYLGYKKFFQEFGDNMSTRKEAQVVTFRKKPFTKITFRPDFAKFKVDGLTSDMHDLIYRRVLDMAACTHSTVSVYFNDKKIEIKNFEKYMDLFIGEDKVTVPRAFEDSERWEIGKVPLFI